MLVENEGMQRVCKKLGYTIRYDESAEVMEAKIKL